jgi:hypothetical protein
MKGLLGRFWIRAGAADYCRGAPVDGKKNDLAPPKDGFGSVSQRRGLPITMRPRRLMGDSTALVTPGGPYATNLSGSSVSSRV